MRRAHLRGGAPSDERSCSTGSADVSRGRRRRGLREPRRLRRRLPATSASAVCASGASACGASASGASLAGRCCVVCRCDRLVVWFVSHVFIVFVFCFVDFLVVLLLSGCSGTRSRSRVTVNARGQVALWRDRYRRCSQARRWRLRNAGRTDLFAQRRRPAQPVPCSRQIALISLAFIVRVSPRASRTWTSRAACARPAGSRRGRAARSTPASSNITRPGLTTATQPSGAPLPEPIRVSAGFFVTGLSGNTLIHTLPPRLILRVIATFGQPRSGGS